MSTRRGTVVFLQACNPTPPCLKSTSNVHEHCPLLKIAAAAEVALLVVLVVLMVGGSVNV